MNREYSKEPLPHKTSVAEDILYLDAETEKELFKARWMVNFIWHRHRRNVTRNFYHQRNTRNILQLLNNHQTVFVMVSHAPICEFYYLVLESRSRLLIYFWRMFLHSFRKLKKGLSDFMVICQPIVEFWFWDWIEFGRIWKKNETKDKMNV